MYHTFTSLLKQVKKLPDSPGVYFFKDGAGKVLYIGRATSLKERVRSYLNKDLIKSRGELVVQMIALARKVSFAQTDSVLEAMILESNLIKKHAPYYNSREKDDKSYNYLVVTREDFPRVLVVRGKDLDQKFSPRELRYVFGPYPQGGHFKEAVKLVRKIFPFRDACTPGAGRPCFNAQLNLCPGVCRGGISKSEYGRTIKHIRLLFEGKKPALLKVLKRDMREYIKAEAFEAAGQAKRKIFALEHIQDVTLLKREIRDLPRAGNTFRIEAYDVAHLGGDNTVGVMTVVENGEVKKSDNRKFRIKSVSGGDDGAALFEVLSRRFYHDEWRLPNLIVLDGGKIQLGVGTRVLKEFGYEIPLVSVVKNEFHRPRDILGDRAQAREHHDAILLANSEAHRFAISYHKERRRKALFI
jgi:excinuclease ABC subunit C